MQSFATRTASADVLAWSVKERAMHRKIRQSLTGIVVLQTLAASACSSGPDHSERGAANRVLGGFDGFEMTSSPLLAAGCTIAGSAMNVIVKDGESALITLRPLDSVITVNGNIFTGPDGGAGSTIDSGRACEVPLASGTINIVADTGGTYALGRSVVLDYINGLFALGNSTAPGIRVDFTLVADTNNGAKNSLRVRGSDGADLFAIGAGTTLPVLNVNAGFTASPTADGGAAVDAGARDAGARDAGDAGAGAGAVATDLLADVSFKNIGNVMIATGAGDDRVDGSGTAGTGLAYPGVLTLFGNDGADILSGGAAADLITGGLGNDVLNGCAGNDTYLMGSAAAGADVIAQACPTAVASEGNDTVDYSLRTLALTVNLSSTLTSSNSGTDTLLSGESLGDGAHISDKVAFVKLGGGNDTLTMTNSTLTHRVTGGAGNDTITGAAGRDSLYGDVGTDILYGGAGDDTLVGGPDVDTLVGGNGNDMLQGDAANDSFTCDGKNAAADLAVGTAPGENDILVDFTASADTKTADCEFF
jgi:Ca2+-binding RTX toxin-like protein